MKFKMKMLILLLLPLLVMGDFYKETQDFKYSRTSDDEQKQGYYASQTGNMGGNYEESRNMDSVANTQMKDLMHQVGSQLGLNPDIMGKGYSSSNMNAKALYGSASASGRSTGIMKNHGGTSLSDRNSDNIHSMRESDYSNIRHGYSTAQRGSSGGSTSDLQLKNYDRFNNNEQTKGESLTRDIHMGQNQELESHHASRLHSDAYGRSNQQRKSEGVNYQTENYHAMQSEAHKVNSESYFNQEKSDTTGNEGFSNDNSNIRKQRIRLVVRPGETIKVPVMIVSPGTQSSNTLREGYSQGNIASENRYMDSQGQVSGVNRNVNRGESTNMDNSQYYQSSRLYSENDRRSRILPTDISNQQNGYIPVSQIHVADKLYQTTDSPTNTNNHKMQSQTSNMFNRGSRVASTNRYYNRNQETAEQTHNSDTHNNYDLREENLKHTGNINVESSSTNKPKVYQSSYSYHKSWEKHMGPYVITENPSYSNNQNGNINAQNQETYYSPSATNSRHNTESSNMEKHLDVSNLHRSSTLQSSMAQKQKVTQAESGDYTARRNNNDYSNYYRPQTVDRKDQMREATSHRNDNAENTDSQSYGSFQTASGHHSSQAANRYLAQKSMNQEDQTDHSQTGMSSINMDRLQQQLRNQMQESCPNCEKGKTRGFSASYSYSSHRSYGGAKDNNDDTIHDCDDDTHRSKRNAFEQQVENTDQQGSNFFQQEVENLGQSEMTVQQTENFEQEVQQSGRLEFLGQNSKMIGQQSENIGQENINGQTRITNNMQNEYETQQIGQLNFFSQNSKNFEQETQLHQQEFDHGYFQQRSDNTNIEHVRSQYKEEKPIVANQNQELSTNKPNENIDMHLYNILNEITQKQNNNLRTTTDNNIKITTMKPSWTVNRENPHFNANNVYQTNNQQNVNQNEQKSFLDVYQSSDDQDQIEMSQITQNSHNTEQLTFSNLDKQNIYQQNVVSKQNQEVLNQQLLTTSEKTNTRNQSKSFLDIYHTPNAYEVEQGEFTQKSHQMTDLTDDYNQQQSKFDLQGFEQESQNMQWVQQSNIKENNYGALASSNIETIQKQHTVQQQSSLNQISKTEDVETTTEPGFWQKVGNKIGNAKDKVKGWFG